jgi:hypothetical protein
MMNKSKKLISIASMVFSLAAFNVFAGEVAANTSSGSAKSEGKAKGKGGPPKSKECPSEKGTDLTFPKGKVFEINEYHPDTESFMVSSVDLPDESDMEVTLEGMADAVPKIKANMNMGLKYPVDMVGEKYKTAKELQVLTSEETEARRNCFRKK